VKVSRREFLGTAAAGTLAAGAASAARTDTALPTLVLGKTGVRVPILGMGAGSRFLMYKEEDEAIAAMQKAIEAGITYIDSSDDYGKDHLSEHRVGKAIKGRRGDLFIATKVSVRDGDAAARHIEESLKALDVDHVDLLHIHQLMGEDDLAKIEEKGAVLDRLLKAKEQKMTRFIGITSHYDPAALKTALERHDFDCTQMALNGALTGMKNGPKGMIPNLDMKTSFETVALPVAVKKNMGILAMKIFAQEALVGKESPEKLLYYSLSLPVSAAVVGMPKPEFIEENARLARAFKPLQKKEMKRISLALATENKLALDHFFQHHRDA